MRRWRAIIAATAIEALSEPLVLMMLVTSMVLSTVAPAIHYHQFGEPTRMARDAGLSAALLGGIIITAFIAVRSFRRELESGTIMTALIYPISRTNFYLAKCIGLALGYLVFAIIIYLNSVVIVNGAAIGAKVADTGIAKIWGASLALGLTTILLPLLLGAILNRAYHTRFTLSTIMMTLLFAIVAVFYRFDHEIFFKLLPVHLLGILPALFTLCIASAFSVRFKFNVAMTITVIILLLFIPALGNYCLADALASGGEVSLSYLFLALGAIAPLIAVMLILGARFLETLEVG